MKLNREMMEKALQRKIFVWVDSVMKEVLPSHIYHKSREGNAADKRAAVGWLQERGYRVVSQPDGVIQVFQGTALLRQTKLVLELNNPEELLEIAEVVKNNANIPPPPWQPKNENLA